ncbi:MAG: hypothetical protein HDR15_06705 [Lachnospiraceae bacterium]|nr:hypothetical protein [Lachnospiraceae bacterium]
MADSCIFTKLFWKGKQAAGYRYHNLQSYDFSGKTIVPFCISQSSGIGSGADNLHVLCPDTTIIASHTNPVPRRATFTG